MRHFSVRVRISDLNSGADGIRLVSLWKAHFITFSRVSRGIVYQSPAEPLQKDMSLPRRNVKIRAPGDGSFPGPVAEAGHNEKVCAGAGEKRIETLARREKRTGILAAFLGTNEDRDNKK